MFLEWDFYFSSIKSSLEVFKRWKLAQKLEIALSSQFSCFWISFPHSIFHFMFLDLVFYISSLKTSMNVSKFTFQHKRLIRKLAFKILTWFLCFWKCFPYFPFPQKFTRKRKTTLLSLHSCFLNWVFTFPV